MALIKCVECGKMISDKSSMCLSCGCPTSYILETYENIRKAEALKQKRLEEQRRLEEERLRKIRLAEELERQKREEQKRIEEEKARQEEIERKAKIEEAKKRDELRKRTLDHITWEQLFEKKKTEYFDDSYYKAVNDSNKQIRKSMEEKYYIEPEIRQYLKKNDDRFVEPELCMLIQILKMKRINKLSYIQMLDIVNYGKFVLKGFDETENKYIFESNGLALYFYMTKGTLIIERMKYIIKDNKYNMELLKTLHSPCAKEYKKYILKMKEENKENEKELLYERIVPIYRSEEGIYHGGKQCIICGNPASTGDFCDSCRNISGIRSRW